MSEKYLNPSYPTDYVPNTRLDAIDQELDTIFDEAITEGYGPDSANKDQLALLDQKAIELLEEMYTTPEGEMGDPDLSDALTEVSERADHLRKRLRARRFTL